MNKRAAVGQREAPRSLLLIFEDAAQECRERWPMVVSPQTYLKIISMSPRPIITGSDQSKENPGAGHRGLVINYQKNHSVAMATAFPRVPLRSCTGGSFYVGPRIFHRPIIRLMGQSADYPGGSGIVKGCDFFPHIKRVLRHRRDSS
ncbi:hypothetical protein CEXT_314061 [Caerostris extrusa]|uniref:Uncharacterized protein n=1 Tax=Caerostris extrusa TaxID=172846 RepID=A0AAV4PDZ4_CAEEX|nr:hypothetical protein CEXT_314061 [Caerostris extrusa]